MKIRLSPKRKVVLIDINATQDLIKIWNRRWISLRILKLKKVLEDLCYGANEWCLGLSPEV
jgi:hypothetical protein